MNLYRFTEAGISRFDDFRASPLRAEDQLREILQDATCSVTASADIEVGQVSLPTRFDVGEYLYGLFGGAEALGLHIDVGIWTWLAAFYFDQLCPPGSSPGDKPRWVPAVDNYRQYYRHLLGGVVKIRREW